MCGGVGFRLKNISEEELIKYYSAIDIKSLKKDGRIESFFWKKTAVLPVRTKKGVQLKLWGNKDKKLKLPPTGWARQDSLLLGKWDYLHPRSVEIPVDSGFEKNTRFDFKNGTKGILLDSGEEERVYMITGEASKEYRHKTGHDREPIGEKNNFKIYKK